MISIYVIQIILILFFGLVFRKDKKKFLSAAFVVLFVVMAFREATMVGNDSATSYYTEFLNAESSDLSSPNPGLPIVMEAIYSLGGAYQWFIVITAIWVCFAYYRLLIKYSDNGFISVMWFMGMLFYTFLFSALKQAWAMAFLCFAFDAIFQKKPIRFLLLVALATVFHFPALVFLPAYWIAKFKINRAFPLLMFSVLVFVFIFRTRILDLMSSAYGRGGGEYTSDVRFLGTKFAFMIIMLAYGFFQYYKNDDNAGTNADVFSTLIYFMGISAVIQTFCFYSNNFERLADFYYQFSILFVPMILLKSDAMTDGENSRQMGKVLNSSTALTKKKIGSYSVNDIDISTVLTVVITAFCIWRFINFTDTGSDSLTPFYFFWQGISTTV